MSVSPLFQNDTSCSVMEFVSPKTRAAAARVSNHFHGIANKAGERHLKAVVGCVPEGINANRHLYALNGDLKGLIQSYPDHQVPEEIAEILDTTLTIRETTKLQQFVKARDTLVVWEVLAEEIGNDEDFTRAFSTADAAIKKAEGFSKWVAANQDALNGVRFLNLNSKQLRELPAEVGNLAQLRRLNCYENRLRELPAEIGKLAQLHTLNLNGNELRELPAEIGNLGQLQLLSVFDNQLRELPAEIGNLAQLQHLRLNGNELRELPAEIGNLAQLRSLLVGCNQLRELPAAIVSLPHLDASSFIFSGNPLS